MKKAIGKWLTMMIATMAFSVLMTATVAAKTVTFTVKNSDFSSPDFSEKVKKDDKFDENDTLKFVSDQPEGFTGLINHPQLTIMYQYSNGKWITTSTHQAQEGEKEVGFKILKYDAFNSWMVDDATFTNGYLYTIILKPDNSDDDQSANNDETNVADPTKPVTTPGDKGDLAKPITTPGGDEGKKYDTTIWEAEGGKEISKAEVVKGTLPPGLELVVEGGKLKVKGTPTKPGTYEFTVKITLSDGTEVTLTFTITIKGESKESSSGDGDNGAVVNPDALAVNYYLTPADHAARRRDYKAGFGKQIQGPACQAAFNASVPSGWSQAFTFSMSYDKKNTTALKNGIIELYVPIDYMKAGRSYAIMAMDQSGVVKVYQDTDTLPYVFTSPLNVEGYAFSLLIKD